MIVTNITSRILNLADETSSRQTQQVFTRLQIPRTHMFRPRFFQNSMSREIGKNVDLADGFGISMELPPMSTMLRTQSKHETTDPTTVFEPALQYFRELRLHRAISELHEAVAQSKKQRDQEAKDAAAGFLGCGSLCRGR